MNEPPARWQVEAFLPERMTELVNREGLPDRGWPGRHGHHPGGPGADDTDEAPADDAG